MDPLQILTLVFSGLGLLTGGGLLMQKRREGVEWGSLVTKVDQLGVSMASAIDKLGTQDRAITQFQTALLGIDGRGGALAEIAQLRGAKHDQGDMLHGHAGRLDLHGGQLADHEKRIGTTERELDRARA